jgi:hypothetical protein
MYRSPYFRGARACWADIADSFQVPARAKGLETCAGENDDSRCFGIFGIVECRGEIDICLGHPQGVELVRTIDRDARDSAYRSDANVAILFCRRG